MSLFVRVNTNFYTHRKTARLRAALGNDALWIPPRLWAYCAEHSPDGNLRDYSAEEIACLIGYTGDATSMLQALLKAGFLDADPLRIHDWQEHNGYHVKYAERASNAAKARWQKERRPKEKQENETEKERRGEETSNASGMLKASETPNAPPRMFPREAKDGIEILKGKLQTIRNRLSGNLNPEEQKKLRAERDSIKKQITNLERIATGMSDLPPIETAQQDNNSRNRGIGGNAEEEQNAVAQAVARQQEPTPQHVPVEASPEPKASMPDLIRAMKEAAA